MNQPKDEIQAHYVHRLSYSARERLVGVFILLTMLFLLALVGVNENTLRFFEKKIEYHVYFTSAKGLSTDTLIKVSGLEVGKVAALDIAEDHKIHATIHVYDRYAHLIRAGAVAKLNRLAVLGTATIEISTGSLEDPQLPDGAFMPAEETPSLDDLIEGLAALVSAGSDKSTATLLADLSTVIGNLKDVTGKISSGEGTLGTLIYAEDLQRDLTNTVALLQEVMAGTRGSVAEVKPLISDVRKVVRDIRDTTAELPDLVTTANRAVAKAESTITVLDNEMGQFPDLLVRLNLVLEEATRVLEAMQRVWPISSAVRPQDEQQMIKANPVND